MKSLADILLAPQQRDALIADAASMVEQHIQQRGGLKGIGMKTGLSLLKAARPDILQRASARMLPDMITALEPLYTQFRNSGDGDFAVFLGRHADTATELLLEDTESEWNPAGPSPAVVLNRHRSQHIGQLALLLPRLQNWRQCNTDPFQGSLVRG